MREKIYLARNLNLHYQFKINVQRYNICTIDLNGREFSAFIYKNMLIGNKRIITIKHKEINFDSIVYTST